MSDFPECMKRRGGPEDDTDGQRSETGVNGQVCHRIAGHSGGCLFDRPAEFTPLRMRARPLPERRLTPRSLVPMRLRPNPAAEA